MEANTYEVFIQINERKCVNNINSNIVIKDKTNWIKIDKGLGERFACAQSKYFSKPLTGEQGVFNYKYDAETNTVSERTPAEIQGDIDSVVNTTQPTAEERLAALESVIIGLLEI